MIAKLTKTQQTELNESVEKVCGIKSSIRSLSLDLGEVERDMWKLTRRFADGKKIAKIEINKGEDSAIVLED